MTKTYEESQREATDKIRGHLAEFDQHLKLGDLVEIRWTNSGRYHSARAIVATLNAKSIACYLAEALEGYPVKARITAPRIVAERWSGDNGVFPLPPLQGIMLTAHGAKIARPKRGNHFICDLFGVAPATKLMSRQLAEPFVALYPTTEKQLPIGDGLSVSAGPYFIVRRPYNVGGYWRSLTSRDVGEFTRLYGIKVSWGDVQEGDVR